MARARRGRGENGIYQRASDGLWVGSVSLGYGANGKRRRRVVYARTKQELKAKLKDPGVFAAAGPLTLSRWLATWLESVKESVEPTTWDGYEQHVRLHLDPSIGFVKLKALTSVDVEDLDKAMRKAGASSAMRRKVGVTLRTALNAALRRSPPEVPVNVALSVPLPKVPKYVPRVWTPDQVTAFLAATEADRFRALFVVAIDSGCRQSELLALRWSDFDPKTGQLTVTKALANRRGKMWEKEGKTAKSRRMVVLVFGVAELSEHRKRMEAEGRDVAAGLMFPDTDGGHMQGTNLYNRHFIPALERAGLPPIRFHDLRHCCASFLLAAGVDTKVVSERLGHSSPGFTAATYQHVLPGLQAQAADRLNALLSAAGPGGK